MNSEKLHWTLLLRIEIDDFYVFFFAIDRLNHQVLTDFNQLNFFVFQHLRTGQDHAIHSQCDSLARLSDMLKRRLAFYSVSH